MALFRLREMQGRSAEALGFLERLEEAWPDIAFCTRGLRAVHALRRSPDDPAVLADAAAWSQAFALSLGGDMPAFGIGMLGGAEIYYLASLAWARCQIATGPGLDLLQAPGAEWCALVRVEPRRVQIRKAGGRGNLETIEPNKVPGSITRPPKAR